MCVCVDEILLLIRLSSQLCYFFFVFVLKPFCILNLNEITIANNFVAVWSYQWDARGRIFSRPIFRIRIGKLICRTNEKFISYTYAKNVPKKHTFSYISLSQMMFKKRYKSANKQTVTVTVKQAKEIFASFF